MLPRELIWFLISTYTGHRYLSKKKTCCLFPVICCKNISNIIKHELFATLLKEENPQTDNIHAWYC